MKNQLFIGSAIPLVLLLLAACNAGENKPAVKAESERSGTNPIDGAWELVWENVDGKSRDDGKTTQFKIFNDRFFSFIAQDSTGKTSLAASGSFTIDGNTYKESFQYCTNPDYVGATDWQEYELKGDTLYFKGFTKVTFSNGEDKTNSFPKFEEKRVRAKH